MLDDAFFLASNAIECTTRRHTVNRPTTLFRKQEIIHQVRTEQRLRTLHLPAVLQKMSFCAKARWLCCMALLLGFNECNAFAPSHSPGCRVHRNFHVPMTGADDSDQVDDGDGEDQPIAEATMKIDDGGSNLTDRFKWKVNALMGVFDPQGEVDDDRQEGNILNALLNFPVRYTFNIIGKTSGDGVDDYVEAVKKVVMATAGDEIACKITPRGKNYTKVQCEVEVQNAAMINNIYDELEKMERTVMRF